jgi:hypothetical protein
MCSFWEHRAWRNSSSKLKFILRYVTQYWKLKSTIFWDKMLPSPLKVLRRFGGIYRLHLQDRINRTRNLRESRWQVKQLLSRRYLVLLILRHWGIRRYIPSKRRLTFRGLHGVISQKIASLNNYRFANLKCYDITRLNFIHCPDFTCIKITAFWKLILLRSSGEKDMINCDCVEPLLGRAAGWRSYECSCTRAELQSLYILSTVANRCGATKYKHSSLLLARLTSALVGFLRLSSALFGTARWKHDFCMV